MNQTKAEGPLAGLRVIEMGTLIAGPFCGQILGDFGAEVIKLEDPKTGDPMRQWGRSLPKGLSPWWPVIGRNKKSVGVDLRTPEGQALARTLIGKADIVVENFRVGGLEKWGLGWERLSADNPRLIMARVTGYGQTGPLAGRAGYGLIGEAFGGLRHVIGEPDRPPARAGISIGDSLSAMHAVMGILMAMHVRETTGRGQMIDVALYESVLAVMENLITEYDLTGYVRERTGAILPGIAPSSAYPCADGEMILIGGNGDNVFARLCQVMGSPQLKDDPKFVDHAARGINQSELDSIVAAWTSTQTLTALIERLEAESVPCGRIYRAPDMLEDPQYIARDSIVETDHPGFGKVKMQNVFPRLPANPGKVRWPGPALGEHTDEVLREVAGYGPARIAELRAKGVV